MYTPEELIDKAASVVGSYAEVARRLGVKPQHVNNWKRLKPCPLHVQAQLAAMAGLDWKSHVCDVIAEKAGHVIATVAAVAIIGGVVSVPSPAEASQATLSPAQATDRLYIMLTSKCAMSGVLTA